MTTPIPAETRARLRELVAQNRRAMGYACSNPEHDTECPGGAVGCEP